MGKFDVFHKYGKELEQQIRMLTYPLAITLIEKESDIPKRAQKPMRDFGYHLSVCQGFSMARREGITIVMMLEDMWCPESVIGYGLVEPPQYFYDGYHRFPQTTETLKAGSIWASELPHPEWGKYIGIAAAPLTTCDFKPDVALMYVDSTQLGHLLLAAATKEGHELTCTVSAKGGCVYSVIPPLLSGKYQVTVPCPGDRRFAGAQHDEIIFSLPIKKIADLLTSLRYLDDYAYRLPFRCIMQPEHELPENYVELGKMMGMEYVKGDEIGKYGRKK